MDVTRDGWHRLEGNGMKINLPARDAAWLASTMQKRRSEFGGWFMEADPAPAGGDPAPAAPAPDSSDSPLGEPGKKALDAERDARKEAEGKVKQLEADFGTMKSALMEAFGVKPEKGADATDVLKQVQDQLSQMQRENAVLALANEHGITDKADIDLLKQSGLQGDALATMAARLKPTGDPKPGTPKPDSSQGGSGDPAKPDPGPGYPRLAAAYANSSTTKS